MIPGQEKEKEAINKRMTQIKNTILVLSGKGGVGKSTVAVNIAAELAGSGKRVGILDVDIHGPSIPGMFGIEGEQVMSSGEAIIPVKFTENLLVMSIGFLIKDRKDAVIWRGPMKYNVIKQFIADVEWGKLDYLIVDCPPGTGDEPLSVAQLVGENANAVVVTTPQRVSIDDVRKSITFCRKLNVNILGIVENMSGFVCPNCGIMVDIFDSGGGEMLGKEMDVAFLGRIPIDPNIVGSCDEGKPYILSEMDSSAMEAFHTIVERLVFAADSSKGNEETEINKEKNQMKIAIPVTEGKLAMHFGHCEKFAIIDVNTSGKIMSKEELIPPPHEPGVLPAWLHEQGATHIITGGIGSRARGLFSQHDINVVTGAPVLSPEEIAEAYINGTLDVGDNVCDH